MSLEIWRKKSPETSSEYSAKGDISPTTYIVEGYHDHSEVHLRAKGLALCLLCFGHNFLNKFFQLIGIVRWFQQVAAKIGNILYELDPLLGDVLACRQQIKEHGELCLSSFYDVVREWMPRSEMMAESQER